MAFILNEIYQQAKEKIKSALSKNKKVNYADCIIRNTKGEILLLQRSFQDDFMAGKWCLAGGKIEEGEEPAVAAIREAQEETGLDIVYLTDVKTVEKKDCVIHYFQTVIPEDSQLVLDNNEHRAYEFVPFEKLGEYDLILDLGETLKDIYPTLPVIINPVKQIDEAELIFTMPEITKAFDEGLIDEEDYINHVRRAEALNTIIKAHGLGLIPDEKFYDALEKAKHYEFVKVVRDGKQFYQYREVGTDKVEEEIETGSTIETSEDLGLNIKKYSDKSILITGNTYKNLDLLRKMKESAGGYGTWNKALGGWIFPLFAKDKICALLADKMNIDTYDATKAKEALIELKNSVDVGTPVTVNGKETEIQEVTTSDEGKTEYKTEDNNLTETEIGIPPADKKKAEELINNATEENRMKTGKMLFGKEEGETPVSKEIEKEGQKEVKIEVREFTTRSGEKVQALDFTGVRQDEIQLADITTILDKERPYYIPEINEYMFSGSRDDKFIFDYVKMEDGNFLVSLNGYKDSYTFNSDKRYKKVDPAYAVMSLDNLVANTEYYKVKRKAEIKREVDVRNKEIVEKYAALSDEQIEKYKAFNYLRLSASQQKKITAVEWNALPKEEKLKWVDGMTSPIYARKTQKRIKVLEDDTMLRSNFDMYKQYVDKDYKTPFDLGKRYFTAYDPCAIEYSEARDQIKWKKNDLQMQKEENDSSYEKGRETSYGDSGTRNDLLESHGVKIKSQNGKELQPSQIEDIRTHLSKVYQSFGDRSSMSKNFGLKISHAGNTRMHAMKFVGVYIPSMRAIGVSHAGNFGFTLAHEMAHFLDNYLGKQSNRYFASDDYNSTAGKIAKIYRSNMNKKTDSTYYLRSCENFARAFESYHAYKELGDENPYFTNPFHVNKEVFVNQVKPLIEQFLKENDHLLKSAIDELNFFDVKDCMQIINYAHDKFIK